MVTPSVRKQFITFTKNGINFDKPWPQQIICYNTETGTCLSRVSDDCWGPPTSNQYPGKSGDQQYCGSAVTRFFLCCHHLV